MSSHLRLSLRSLSRTPGFSLIAVAILALGIGASTAIFSVVHALLLAPLPYHDSHALVAITTQHQEQGTSGLAPATFGDLATGPAAFSAVAAQYYYYVNLTGSGEPALVTSADVSADYFRLFGVAPLRGRHWTADEAKPSAAPVVLLGYDLWRRQFNSRDSVVGEQILLDNVASTVLGVMPASFKEPSETGQIFRPMRFAAAELTNRTARYWTVFGRLAPGVPLERANAELAGFSRQLEQAHPKNYENSLLQADDLQSRVVGDYHSGLLLVLGAVGCVMLITCANIAGLAIVRAAGRRKEFAIRAALGAARGQLLRQLLAESLLLALGGGALGVLLGRWGLDALLAGIPPGWLPRAEEISLNLPVLAATLGLTLLTGLAFGLAPGFSAARVDCADALKDNSHGSTGPAARRLRSGLVIVELALALVLLVAAGLLGKNLVGLLHRKTGFDAARVLSLTVSLAEKRYDTVAKRLDFYSRVETEVAAVPGVQSAGFTETSPFRWGRPLGLRPVARDGAVSDPNLPQAFYDSVSVDYFKTIGCPLLAGRLFTATDNPTSKTVVIISESMARRLFGKENPLGRELTNGVGSPLRLEVIGVVGDVRRSGLANDVPLQAYRSLAQRPPAFGTLMVRTTLQPSALAKSVSQALWHVDPDTPVSDVGPMDAVVSHTVTQPRIYLTLFGLFAALSLVLAAIGLYGLIAYGVAGRMREFGIRAALGASPREIRALVLREGGGLIAIGLGLGLVGAFAAARLLQSMVVDTSVHDPAVFLVVPLVLAGVAALACYVPARRATKVDPMIALRAE